jgi:hypothetical protein
MSEHGKVKGKNLNNKYDQIIDQWIQQEKIGNIYSHFRSILDEFI